MARKHGTEITKVRPDGRSERGKRQNQRAQRSEQRRARRRPFDDADLPTDVRGQPAVRRQRPNHEESFRCRHCRALVGLVPSGGRHRNHCPVCLYSRHVDERIAGDRASQCGGSMAPIGVFCQRNGEQSLVHRCLTCGVIRHNRIAADDDYDLVVSLPDLTQPVHDDHDGVAPTDGPEA